ncbi:MAG: prepilin-type N-terminal cleavage/methylation domain-containing protein [Planctomycetes bacterium]|nr:prepilin-type N-terminal cleavage/methylation domain-containing protein [Planctomycetota bacterium]MCH8118932.1 prepilin-type N-terminal cleavage/methylation domain-containing protein [Planctomycetota bacterium]
MKRKGQKGFTLIELIIAMFTSTIVIVAAGSILFYGQKSWNNILQRVNLQRDASYAMQRMSRTIKAGTSARIEGNGTGIRIYNDVEGVWRRFFVQPVANNANNLTLKTAIVGESISDETILDDKVEDLQFNVTGTTVSIELKLRDDNLQTHFVSTVMMRNYGQ